MRVWANGGLPLRRGFVKGKARGFFGGLMKAVKSQPGYVRDIAAAVRSPGQILSAARRANRVLHEKVVRALTGLVVPKEELRAVIEKFGVLPGMEPHLPDLDVLVAQWLEDYMERRIAKLTGAA